MNIHFYTEKLDCGGEDPGSLSDTHVSTFKALVKYQLPMKLHRSFLVRSNINYLGISYHLVVPLSMNHWRLALQLFVYILSSPLNHSFLEIKERLVLLCAAPQLLAQKLATEG